MKCRICGVEKLSREFPREPISEDCDHPALYCLRCVTSKVRSAWKCPYDGCGLPVESDNLCLKECDEMLEFLFPQIPAPDDLPVSMQDGSVLTVQVTTLTGDNESFEYRKNKTIRELKREISERMDVEIGKQRLVYNGTELKTEGKATRLSDFDVKPYSTIHLMVLLYAVPENLNHVIFELSWSYPNHGRDFLDALCLVFMNDVLYSFIDWRYKQSCGVLHSGDLMDDKNRRGQHRMEAKLKEIPLCVSHLVFTLSSFKAPSIAAFRNPTLKFYDATSKDELCSASFERAISESALIVCCVSRQTNGGWRIDKGGHTCDGNAKDFNPMLRTMKILMGMNCFPGVSLAYGEPLVRMMNDKEEKEFNSKCKNRLLSGAVY